MRFTPSEMPSTEQVALQVLIKEGFTNIHWESLVNWQSFYDFRATKNGIEYLIEVKPEKFKVSEGKLKMILAQKKPVLFLIVGVDTCQFIHLRDFLHLKEIKLNHAKRVIVKADKYGRLTIPEYLREALGLEKGVGVFVEVSAEPSLDDCKGLILKKT